MATKIGTFVDASGNVIAPKTNGKAVTINFNGQKFLLDDFFPWLLDHMFPVGEQKDFTHDVGLLAVLNALGQEWQVPEGQLLPRTSYPALFGKYGYKYGWGDTNPFTGDRDAQGNAIATSTSHTFFRVADERAKFLRARGTTPSLTNTWTDESGASHSVATTYSAEMYKTVLDAIRNIDGSIEGNIYGGSSGVAILSGASGAFVGGSKKVGGSFSRTGGTNYTSVKLDTGLVVPTASENRPVSMSLYPCIRVL